MDEDPVAAGQRPLGLVASESRVVRQPGRWSRLLAVVVVVGLVAGGVLWWAGTGGPGDDGGEEPRSASTGDGRSTRVAFREAVNRLMQSGAFAYRGDVHAVGQSAFRPGVQTAVDVSVEGAVLLHHGLTRDVAVDSLGRATETVTSGPTVWTRSATTAEALDAEPWEVGLSESTGLKGTAAVAVLLPLAREPRDERPDADGRRVIRATLPPADPRNPDRDLLAGAEVVLMLDARGNVARMSVSSAPVDAELRLDLAVIGAGQAQAIAPPDDGETGLRRTIPVHELAAAGVHPVELGRVPAGWRLIGAWVVPGPEPGECPRLHLTYRQPDAVIHGFLQLTVTATQCRWAGREDGVEQPLTAGSFEGLVVEAPAGTSGDIDDGTTRVSFRTDLSPEDAAAVLASLQPFDPDADPAPFHGIPSPSSR
jgi:hypothetical protein